MIWIGLALVAVGILLVAAFPVRATDSDGPEVWHCGTVLAPRVYPNGAIEGTGTAIIVNDDCYQARTKRSEWAYGTGLFGIVLIGAGTVTLHHQLTVKRREVEESVVESGQADARVVSGPE
jgi:hypothetical protein